MSPTQESPAEKMARARRISAKLRQLHESKTALDFANPFQLLIATILSAQSTDVAVNKVTPILFGKYPDARSLAQAQQEAVEEIIHSTGFFKQKARAIIGCAQALVDKFKGRVPESMGELTSLPGVGRKTAHVLRGNALGKPAIFVDTHFKRLSGLMELCESDDPEKIEVAVAALLPENEWTHFSNAIIWHGRRVCIARKPRCAECVVRPECPYGRNATIEATGAAPKTKQVAKQVSAQKPAKPAAKPPRSGATRKRSS